MDRARKRKLSLVLDGRGFNPHHGSITNDEPKGTPMTDSPAYNLAVFRPKRRSRIGQATGSARCRSGATEVTAEAFSSYISSNGFPIGRAWELWAYPTNA